MDDVINTTIANPSVATILNMVLYRSYRFSRTVLVMVGADGSDSELLAATKCTPRLQ